MTPDLDRSARDFLFLVLDASLRGLVLAAVAALFLAVVRPRRSAVRLGVWSVVLYGSLLVPAFGAVLPAVGWPMPVAAAVQAWTAVEPPPAAGDVDTAAVTLAAEPVVEANTDTRPIAWFAVAAAIYAAGVVLLLLRAGVGWRMTRRLERSARPIDDNAVLARVRQIAAARGMSRAPRLAEADRLLVPVTMAVVDPIVLLPPDWREWSPETLDAVLAHEVAHAARRDTLMQRISLLYRALTWWHPLSWWLHHRLADLAEQASDEAALEAGAERTAYATVLVDFFSRVRHEPRRAAWHLAMARRAGAGAERRVDRILSWKGGAPMRHTRLSLIAIVVAAAPVVALTAAVRPSAPAAPEATSTSLAVESTPPAIAAPDGAGQTRPQKPPPPPPLPAVRLERTAQTTVLGVALGIAPRREGQPATIVRATSTAADGAYASIVVRNDASKPIRSVVVAASVRPAGDASAAPRVFTSPPLVTWIAPAASQTLQPRLVDPAALKEIAALGPKGATGAIAIVRVEFGDGSVWTASGTGAPQATAASTQPAAAPEMQSVEEFRAGSYGYGTPGLVVPEPLTRIQPKYTSDAMRAKLQGQVHVEVVVDVDGAISRARVVHSLDPLLGLDDAAIEAARQWIFKPGVLNGQPVPVHATIVLEFKLH